MSDPKEKVLVELETLKQQARQNRRVLERTVELVDNLKNDVYELIARFHEQMEEVRSTLAQSVNEPEVCHRCNTAVPTTSEFWIATCAKCQKKCCIDCQNRNVSSSGQPLVERCWDCRKFLCSDTCRPDHRC